MSVAERDPVGRVVAAAVGESDDVMRLHTIARRGAAGDRTRAARLGEDVAAEPLPGGA